MTRIIINPRQLKAINEASFIAGGQYGPNTPNPTIADAARNYFQAHPETPDNQSVYFQNADKTADKEAGVYDTNLGSTPNDGNDSQGMTATKNSITSESRYSKRQVELGRMLEMRRTGKVFSKKQLNEMFMETQENADELRNIFKNGGGRNLAFKVAEIIDDVFPEESYGSELLDAVLGGADPAEFIIQNIFSDFADKEQEREVLDRIRELTTKRGF